MVNTSSKTQFTEKNVYCLINISIQWENVRITKKRDLCDATHFECHGFFKKRAFSLALFATDIVTAEYCSTENQSKNRLSDYTQECRVANT
mmetsp:Transcript_5624/g.5869  ORF Transcript_5624/g.5869 Transcript_5624/m.5869 type:complete len:91 (-) Transcript_5624:265-537(-)